MNCLFKTNENVPSNGYILKNWNQIGYRSTAIAYLQREDLFTIENTNGKWYSLIQLKNAIIQ